MLEAGNYEEARKKLALVLRKPSDRNAVPNPKAQTSDQRFEQLNEVVNTLEQRAGKPVSACDRNSE